MAVRSRLALAGILVLGLLVPGTVALGAFSSPILLRQASLLRLQDVAYGGGAVAVGWREGSSPGELWVRVSTDQGASFKPKFQVAGLGTAGMSLAICSGQVWAVTAAEYPGDDDGDADLLLSRRTAAGGGAFQLFLTQPGTRHAVRQPAIACVGNRLLAVAWLERTSAGTKAYLLLRDQKSLLPSATNKVYDLGSARLNGGIAVAATNDAAFVAWSRSDARDLIFKRFSIGSGASPDITPRKVAVLASADAVWPELAARGEKVLVAYTDAGLLKSRLSADLGRTFADPLTLISAGSAGTPAEATSVDLKGSRLVVEALRRPPKASAAGPAALSDRVPYRLQSQNLGQTWAKVPLGNKGSRVGVLRPTQGSASLLLEAWDDDGAVDLLRFQRETS